MGIMLFACALALVVAVLIGMTCLVSISAELGMSDAVAQGEVLDFLADADRVWVERLASQNTNDAGPLLSPIVGLAA